MLLKISANVCMFVKIKLFMNYFMSTPPSSPLHVIPLPSSSSLDSWDPVKSPKSLPFVGYKRLTVYFRRSSKKISSQMQNICCILTVCVKSRRNRCPPHSIVITLIQFI